ncbi:MAG: hypothetical protein ABI886_12700 [Betaproteobacteria bacterium]
MRATTIRPLFSQCLRLAGAAVVTIALSACGKQEPPPANVAASPPRAVAPAPQPPPKVVPKPADVAITGVHRGLDLGKYEHVAKEASVFAPTDTIVISVYSDGSAKTATIGVTLLAADGKAAAEQSKNVTYNGSLATAFSFVPAGGWSPGPYKAEVRLNEWLASTTAFNVQ